VTSAPPSEVAVQTRSILRVGLAGIVVVVGEVVVTVVVVSVDVVAVVELTVVDGQVVELTVVDGQVVVVGEAPPTFDEWKQAQEDVGCWLKSKTVAVPESSELN
jgi:hypothetical protein